MQRKNILRTTLASTLILVFPLTTALPLSGCLCGVNKHDKLINLEEECDRTWGDVEAQYQRRLDLLPNAVKIANRVASHEKETLQSVVEARANATKVTIDAKDLNDPERMAKFESSQQEIAQSFGKLMHIAEKYPELKSDQAFADLMTQLEGTENRILIARKKYNAAVAAYNSELKRVSGKALDAITGDAMFQPRTPFKAQAGADQAPDLDL